MIKRLKDLEVGDKFCEYDEVFELLSKGNKFAFCRGKSGFEGLWDLNKRLEMVESEPEWLYECYRQPNIGRGDMFVGTLFFTDKTLELMNKGLDEKWFKIKGGRKMHPDTKEIV